MRTTTLIESLVKPCRSIGSKAGVVENVIGDLNRVFAELKASSDDLTVQEGGSGPLSSSFVKVTQGAKNIATATPTIMTFTGNAIDEGGWADLGVDNTIITVPTGVTFIEVWCVVPWADNTTGFRQVEILKNGSTVIAESRYDPPLIGDNRTGLGTISTGLISVVPGDTFSMRVTQTSGANLLVTINTSMSAFALGT